MKVLHTKALLCSHVQKFYQKYGLSLILETRHLQSRRRNEEVASRYMHTTSMYVSPN